MESYKRASDVTKIFNSYGNNVPSRSPFMQEQAKQRQKSQQEYSFVPLVSQNNKEAYASILYNALASMQTKLTP